MKDTRPVRANSLQVIGGQGSVRMQIDYLPPQVDELSGKQCIRGGQTLRLVMSAAEARTLAGQILEAAYHAELDHEPETIAADVAKSNANLAIE